MAGIKADATLDVAASSTAVAAIVDVVVADSITVGALDVAASSIAVAAFGFSFFSSGCALVFERSRHNDFGEPEQLPSGYHTFQGQQPINKKYTQLGSSSQKQPLLRPEVDSR